MYYASADFSIRLMHHDFRRKARSLQVRLRDLASANAGSTPWLLGRQGFAVHWPLALIHSALYPIPVRRLAGFAPRFFQRLPCGSSPCASLVRCDLLTQRTFTSKSRANAGHTTKRGRALSSPVSRLTSWSTISWPSPSSLVTPTHSVY